jgi:hydrogenase nickel incorporation protein HypA/HybF
MHERSLVRSLIQQVRQIAADNGGGPVRKIFVQIGPLGGVEPELVLTAWEELRHDASDDDAMLAETLLAIEQVPLVARCRNCEITFEPTNFRFRCPACGSVRTETISGDGVMLDRIELADVSEGALP